VRVGPTLEQLLKEYSGDIRVAYKQHPLPMHSNAMIAAEAAMAANAQGKFLEMHTRLMAPTRVLTRDKILEAAKEIGLDIDRFAKDLDSHAHRAAIDEMTGEAMRVGADGTPATFINGRFLSGAQPYEAFKKLVDEELAKVKGKDGGAGNDASARKPVHPGP
jgi:predicted DsbA family dithiol-disulfide isomerase